MKATDTFRQAPWRHNCAQAIAHKWIALFDDKDTVEKYAPLRGGCAPEGMCGALYAATQASPENAEQIKTEFATICGAIHCRELKGTGSIPCEMCVATADSLLEKYVK